MVKSSTISVETEDGTDADVSPLAESGKRVVVFNFAMSPPKNLEKYREVQNQLFVRFQNKRIEVERQFFNARESLRGRHSPEYQAILDRDRKLQETLNEAYTRVKRRNQKYKALSATDEDRVEIERIYAALRENRKSQWEVLKALSKNEKFKADLDIESRILNMRRKLVYNLFGEAGPILQKLHDRSTLTRDEYFRLSDLFTRIAKDRSKRPIPVDWFKSLQIAFRRLGSSAILTQDLKEAVDQLRQFLRDDGRLDREPRANDYGNLWWGTRSKINRSVELAVKSRERLNLPASFKRAEDVSPTLTTQIQNGVTQTELLTGSCNSLKAEILRVYRGGRNRLAKVLLRVGTDENNQPMMLESIVRFHRRDWPAEAKIKEVSVSRRASGTSRHFDSRGQVSFRRREKWFMQFTVEMPNLMERVDQGVVAVDMGWKVLEDRAIRVATWCGENPASELSVPERSRLSIRQIVTKDGKEYGELVLLPSSPDYAIPGLHDRQKRCDDLRSIRDRKFDQIVARLLSARVAGLIPRWVNDRTDTISSWHSHQRLLDLFAECQNRYGLDVTSLHGGWVTDGGDPELISWLFHWAEREVHLHQYEAGNRNRLVTCRKQLYQDFVVMLRRRFARVIVSDTDYRDRKRKPSPAATAPEAGRAEYGGLVATGGLRQLIKTGHRCVDEVTVLGADSRKCQACGTVADPERQLVVTCRHCGHIADRLCTSAANLLAIGCAPSDSTASSKQENNGKPKKKKGERNGKSRWAIRKEISQQPT